MKRLILAAAVLGLAGCVQEPSQPANFYSCGYGTSAHPYAESCGPYNGPSHAQWNVKEGQGVGHGNVPQDIGTDPND